MSLIKHIKNLLNNRNESAEAKPTFADYKPAVVATEEPTIEVSPKAVGVKEALPPPPPIPEVVEPALSLPPVDVPAPGNPYVESLLAEAAAEHEEEQPFKYAHTPFFSCGYENGVAMTKFGRRPDAEWTWATRYELPAEVPEVGTWREENAKAAKLLLEEHGGALTMFFDGSYASQIMFLAFKDAGEIPRVYTVSESGQPDIHIKSLHESNLFSLRTIQIPEDFWQKRGLEISTKFSQINPPEIIRVWASTLAAGVPVLAGYFPYMKKNDDQNWYLGDHQQYFALESLSRHADITCIPSFFKYTEGQMLSYLGQMQKVILDAGFMDSESAKLEMLKHFYPELIEYETPKTKAAKDFEKLAYQNFSSVPYQTLNIYWNEIWNMGEHPDWPQVVSDLSEVL